MSGNPERRPVRAAAMLSYFHRLLSDRVGRGNAPLRVQLHTEEHKELVEALEAEDRQGIARELADIQFISYGTAHAYNIDLDAAVAEVHRANLSKFDGPGLPLLRDDGKVMKPPGFQPPDMTEALRGYPTRAGHQSELEELAVLPYDWDSHDGVPGDTQALASASALIDALASGSFELLPLPAGGVQIKACAEGREIDLVVLPGGGIAGWWKRPVT